MRTSRVEFLGYSGVVSSPESPRSVRKIKQPDKLARLTRIIAGGRRHPEFLIPAAAALYLIAQAVRGIPNFQSPSAVETTADVIEQVVSYGEPASADRDGDYLRDQFGYLGEVVRTGHVGVTITARQGVNIRLFPDRNAGILIGALQSFEYDPRVIDVLGFITRPDGSIWAVQSISEPEDGIRLARTFAVRESGEWLADFVTEDGEVVPGEQLFGPAPQGVAANK